MQSQKKPQEKSNSVSLPALEEEKPAYVRRMPVSALCYFCRRSSHKAADCWNLRQVIPKLIAIDSSLTPQDIFNILIYNQPSDSPAIKQFKENPNAFMPQHRQRSNDEAYGNGRRAPFDYNAHYYALEAEQKERQQQMSQEALGNFQQQNTGNCDV